MPISLPSLVTTPAIPIHLHGLQATGLLLRIVRNPVTTMSTGKTSVQLWQAALTTTLSAIASMAAPGSTAVRSAVSGMELPSQAVF